VSAKYEFIDAQKAQYAIVKMCRWLGVSTSGFYEWRDRPASATARRRERLAALIQWIYDDSDGTYGHRRVHAALVRQGERCSPELVRAIMRELGLVPCQPRPFRPATTVAGGAVPAPELGRLRLLDRDGRVRDDGAQQLELDRRRTAAGLRLVDGHDPEQRAVAGAHRDHQRVVGMPGVGRVGDLELPEQRENPLAIGH